MRRAPARRRAAVGRRGDPSGLRLPGRERGVRAARARRPGSSWIGPPSSAIELMGSKTEARTAMRAAGVPIIPGATEPVEDVAEVLRLGDEIGYPLIVKAAAGGGGKGMKLVARARRRPNARSSRPSARARSSSPTGASTSSATSRIRATSRCRCSPTRHGNVIHLGERDCTIQRRHQKLIEETPSPAVDEALRERIGGIAVDAARAAGYRSRRDDRGAAHGRGRLLLHGDEHAHPGRAHRHRGGDRDRPRARAGAGRRRRAAVRAPGGRRAARATRSSAGSTPRTSRAASCPRPGGSPRYREPSGPGVRVDSGVVAGYEISGLYDPMIAKLIVRGADREHARRRMLRALEEFDDRGAADAARLPPRAARAPLLRRRARPATASSSRRSSRRARRSWAQRSQSLRALPTARRAPRAQCRSVELDGRRFDVHAARAGAALGGARARAAASARRGSAAPAATPSSARCRGRC